MDEEKAVAVVLNVLTEAVDFSGETQLLLSLSSPSNLLLDPPIDQTQPRARGQEGLEMQSLEVSFSRTKLDRERNRENKNIPHREKVRMWVNYFKILKKKIDEANMTYSNCHVKDTCGPGQCGSVGWASSCKLKGH